MKLQEYEFIYERLNTRDDVERLHTQLGYSKDMLYNIIAKKLVRKTLRLFYQVKRYEREIAARWRKGESILHVAKSFDFSPALTANFLLGVMGYSKRQINGMHRDPKTAPNSRLQKEMEEVEAADFIYSAHSHELQAANGRNAEERIHQWLTAHNAKFITEKDSRLLEYHARTPDFLFDGPVRIRGHRALWVESKSSFGDPKEMMRDYKRQFKPYTEHFGQGIVVYWYGFVEGIELDKNIKVVSGDFFST